MKPHFTLSQVSLSLLVALSGYAFAADAAKTEKLAEIVVTAAGTSQDMKDAPASISVVNQQQLKSHPVTNLETALQDVPGVNVSGSNVNKSDIAIRGLPADYTLIMVDGRRQNARESRPNGNGGFEGGFIPPVNAIERIEVVRGPMSSLYGSEAMGGVVNIITKKATKEWTGSLSVGGLFHDKGDFGDGHNGNFFLSGPIFGDKLGIQVYGGGDFRHEDSLEGGFNKNKNRNINAKLTFSPTDKQTFILEGGRHLLHKEDTPGKSLALTTTRGSSVTKNQPSSTRATRNHWSLTHLGDWDLMTTEFSVYQEQAKREVTANGVMNERKPEITNTVVDGKFMLPVDKHFFVFGGQYLHAKLEDESVTKVNKRTVPGKGPNAKPTTTYKPIYANVTNKTHQYAFFLEDEINITDNFLLTLGTRIDKHQKFGTHWSPRAYAVYHINDNFTLKGGIARAFRAPTIAEISEGYVASTERGAGVIYGNPNLKPETSTNEEIGLAYGLDNGLNASVTLFNTDFKNKLISGYTGTSDPITGAKLYTYNNVGKANIKGIEIGAHIPFTEQLSADLTYTYQHSKRKTDEDKTAGNPPQSLKGLPLDNTPKHMASAKLNWQILEDLSAYTRVTYKGKQIWANTRNGSPNVLYRERNAYTTVDLGAAYQLNKNVSFNFAVLNIGNEIGDPVDAAHGGNWTVEDGRRFWTNMNISF